MCKCVISVPSKSLKVCGEHVMLFKNWIDYSLLNQYSLVFTYKLISFKYVDFIITHFYDYIYL